MDSDEPTTLTATPPDMSDMPDTFEGMVDYFDRGDDYSAFLPDGKQYIVCRPFSDGDRRKFQNATANDVRVNRKTDEAKMKLSLAGEAHELIKIAAVGWNIFRKKDGTWVPVKFTKGTPGAELEKFLQTAPPHVVDAVEKAIREHEASWLDQEVTVEAIDERLEELREMRERLVREEEGKAS